MTTLPRVCAAGLLALPLAAHAATESGPAPETPATAADDRFKDLLENSPFLRPLDLSRSLAVTGLADVGGETLATIFDREDSSTTLVTDATGNERGMRITGIAHDARTKQVALKISVRGAEIEIPFDLDALLPRPDNSQKKPQGRGDGERGDRDRRGGDRGRGGSQPPPHIMEKYNALTEEQRGTYWRWAREYYTKHPELRTSDKRYPTVEKALEAVRTGGRLPSD